LHAFQVVLRDHDSTPPANCQVAAALPKRADGERW
jgi:hypothetical protein